MHIDQLRTKFPNIHYHTTAHWKNGGIFEIDNYINEYGLDINPDFQRGHVWTEEQQIKYIEYMLKDPQSGRAIYLNHPGWMSSWEGDFVLVDGLQRLTAASKFLKNEIPVYGKYLNEIQFYEKREKGFLGQAVFFDIYISKLQTRKEVIQWYIDFNAGGTPHSNDEIERVRKLLEE